MSQLAIPQIAPSGSEIASMGVRSPPEPPTRRKSRKPVDIRQKRRRGANPDLGDGSPRVFTHPRSTTDSRANSTQVESLSSHPAWWLHRRAGRSAWWRHGQVRPDGGRPPGVNPLGPLEFSPSPARRRLPVDPLRAARRRLVSRKIRAAERLYLSGTCSRPWQPIPQPP